MADEIPESVKEICKEIGIKHSDACWKLPQNGVWVMKHKALEKVAAYKGVKFDLPEIIESNAEKKICIVLVSGSLNQTSAWSIGEATSYNNRNSYPYAMAEKRAKDRVILKLVGLHGDVYSQVETIIDEDLDKDKPELVCKGQEVQGIESNAQENSGREKQGKDIIPKAVKKFGGKSLSDLNMKELCELEEVCTTNIWKTKIAEAKKGIAVSLTKPASKVYKDGTEVQESFVEADTAWLALK